MGVRLECPRPSATGVACDGFVDLFNVADDGFVATSAKELVVIYCFLFNFADIYLFEFISLKIYIFLSRIFLNSIRKLVREVSFSSFVPQIIIVIILCLLLSHI